MKPKRKLAKDRREEIVQAALSWAQAIGYQNVTRENIAKSVGLTPQAIQHHIGTMAKLRRDIMRRAIATDNLHVLAQGMANKDKDAMKATDEQKALARAAL